MTTRRLIQAPLLAGALLALLALLAPARLAAQDATPAVATGGLAAATEWLIGQQADDGGFPGFEGTSDPSVTIDALVALVAAREAGVEVETGPAIEAAVGYVTGGDVALVYAQTGAGQAAKLVLAALAAGIDPTDVNGVNALVLVENGQNPDNGLYGTGVFDHALALMALTATGSEVPDSAFDALAATQAENGGWAFDGGTDPAAADTNTTAVVLQALAFGGDRESTLVTGGIDFLTALQDESGAFPYGEGEEYELDANSTALATQALIATGGDSAPALEALATFQNESGAFHYAESQPEDNIFATVQAIPALAGFALPVIPAAPGATPAATPVASPVGTQWRLAA